MRAVGKSKIFFNGFLPRTLFAPSFIEYLQGTYAECRKMKYIITEISTGWMQGNEQELDGQPLQVAMCTPIIF